MASIEKKLMLKEVEERLKDRDVFITNYDKISVEEFSKMRKSILKEDAKGFVVKKSIAQLAFNNLGMADASKSLDGAVFLVAAKKDPQNISKLLVEFAKGKEDFNVTGAFIEGGYKDAMYVQALSKLPSREQLLASLVGGIKAPINNFVFGLSGIMKNFVVVLNELSKQKSE